MLFDDDVSVPMGMVMVDTIQTANENINSRLLSQTLPAFAMHSHGSICALIGHRCNRGLNRGHGPNSVCARGVYVPVLSL